MPRSALLLVIAILLLPAGANAQAIQAAGHVAMTPVATETIDLANGGTVLRQTFAGVTIADDHNSMFHLTNQNCAFTTVLAADGTVTVSNGFCDAVDRDGDVFGAWGHADAQGGNWRIIPGTGKFGDIAGGGTYSTAVSWPDGRSAIRWDFSSD